MVKKYAYAIVVICLLLITLALPESRRLMFRQLHCLVKGEEYPGNLQDTKEVGDYMRSLHGSDAEQRDAAWDACASVFTGFNYRLGDKRKSIDDIALAKEAIKLRPDSPESYGLALLAYRVSEKSLYNRKEEYKNVLVSEKPARMEFSDGSFPRIKAISRRIKDIDPKIGRDMLDLAERGSRLAPQNAFFDIEKAYVLYGMRRDAEAAQCVHAAAMKEKFDDYLTLISQAIERNSHRKGLPQTEAWLASDPIHILLCMDMREPETVSRMTEYTAGTLAVNGKSSEAESLLIDMVDVAALMRRGTDSSMFHWDGLTFLTSIERLWPYQLKRHGFTGFRDLQRKQQEHIVKSMRSLGWTKLAARWEREMSIAFRPNVKVTDYILNWEGITVHTHHIFAASEGGRLALQLVFGLLVLVGLMWVAARIIKPGNSRVPDISLTGKTVLAILVLIPWLCVTIFDIALRFPKEFISSFINSSIEARYLMGLSLLLMILWGAVTVALAWRRPDSVNSSLRSGLPILTAVSAMMGFACLYGFVDAIRAYTEAFTLHGKVPTGTSVGSLLTTLNYAMIFASILALVKFIYWQSTSRKHRMSAGKAASAIILLILIPVSLSVIPIYGRDVIARMAMPGIAVLGMLFLAFVVGRIFVLMRTGKCPSPGLCASDTIRSGSIVLAKVVILLYLFSILGQLPSRSSHIHKNDALRSIEMQIIKSKTATYNNAR